MTGQMTRLRRVWMEVDVVEKGKEEVQILVVKLRSTKPGLALTACSARPYVLGLTRRDAQRAMLQSYHC